MTFTTYTLADGRTLVIAESAPRRILDTRRDSEEVPWERATEAGVLASRYQATAAAIDAAVVSLKEEIARIIQEKEEAVRHEASRLASRERLSQRSVALLGGGVCKTGS